MYWPGAVGDPGWGPRGLGCEVSPLPLRMKIRRPSLLKRAAVGYQPVGMNPRTAAAPGRETSTTATVLLSALATSRVAPSGERPRPLGVLPGGAAGSRAMPILSRAVRAARSTTQTSLVLAQATKRRPPSFESTMALGCSPTATSPRGASVAASKTRILAPPHRETNRVLPSGAASVVYASAGRSTA